MNRFGWILLVFVAFFFAFQGFLVPNISADEKMFKSAGANLKSECEKLLKAQTVKVDNRFSRMIYGGYFGKSSISNLEELVEKFEKTKKDCDNRLKLYGLCTEKKLDPVYRKVVDIYFLHDEMDGRSPKDFFYGDSKNETIRRIFAERFGVDVKIWRGINKAGWAKSALPVLAFFSCLIFLICWLSNYLRFQRVVYFVLFWFSFFILPI